MRNRKLQKIAEHLAALAREEGSDFVELARKFSDSLDYRIPLLIRDTETSEIMLPCFRLKPGQITDPIDTPKGFIVFKRVELELIEVRHILISYQGAHGSTQTRTQEEARELAEQVLRRAKKGEDFADLAREYSDSTSAKEGDRIGEIARGMTVPAFDHAAFSLEGRRNFGRHLVAQWLPDHQAYPVTGGSIAAYLQNF